MKRTLFAAGRVPDTLGAGRPHIYVTRAATLSFQELRHLPFEEARRELAHLLLDARPVPGDARRWSFLLRAPCVCPYHSVRGTTRAIFHAEGCPGARPARRMVAYVVPEGGLLLVASVSLAESAPDAHLPGPPENPFLDESP